MAPSFRSSTAYARSERTTCSTVAPSGSAAATASTDRSLFYSNISRSHAAIRYRSEATICQIQMTPFYFEKIKWLHLIANWNSQKMMTGSSPYPRQVFSSIRLGERMHRVLFSIIHSNTFLLHWICIDLSYKIAVTFIMIHILKFILNNTLIT